MEVLHKFVCAERRNGKWYALYAEKGKIYNRRSIVDELPTRNKELELLIYDRKANAQKVCNNYNDMRRTDFQPVKVRKKEK